MIKFENEEVTGWSAAIRGMRNPMNSWDKSDSIIDYTGLYEIGENDFKLMMSLVKAGTDHSKFMRMINVTVDITAPRYWWTEMDTYKVGTVRNSCSTMHKIHSKEFTLDDFSCEHLKEVDISHDIIMTGEKARRIKKEKNLDCPVVLCDVYPIDILQNTIDALNLYRKLYLESKNKTWWWQMIQLLPQSYNQRATVQMNYQVLRSIYHSDRKNHKLDEWREGFMKWIENLPYSELITC